MHKTHAMEIHMLASPMLEPIALAARAVHRIENGRGMRVSCIRGPTWVTQESDPRDLVLASGQSAVLDRGGVAVVYAFRDAVITVGPAWQLPAPAALPMAAQPEAACV
jgi:hypothetical protein